MQATPHTLSPDLSFGVFNSSSGTFVLPSLPFEINALMPVTGPETIQLHLGKHHQNYVDSANKLLESIERRFETAAEVVSFARDTDTKPLLENAGQAINHAFFWACHQAAGLTRPTGSLEVAINAIFGDFDAFIEAAVKLGKSRIGSGWVWLMANDKGEVSLVLTQDAETLLDDETQTALLVCDIWEHAYYLDHSSDRAGWITSFFEQLVDWRFAQLRYDSSISLEPIAP